MRVLIFILLSAVLTISPALAGAQCVPPASGEWLVNETVVCSSKSITLNGNLIINGSGNLTLEDSTLRFNSSSDGEYGIQADSSLYVLGSTIESNTTKAYTFVSNPGAILEIRDSFIHDCGYDTTDDYPSKIGVYVNSDGAYITKTNFSENFYALVLKGSNSVIDNNNVSENPAAGLLVSGNNNNITNNFISYNGFEGLQVEHSKNTLIEGNTILENNQGPYGMGIDLWYTEDTSLIDNFCEGNVEYDIYMLSSVNNLLVNTDYTSLWKGWYMNVTVVNNAGNPVEGADVVIKNNFTKTAFSDTTNSEGMIFCYFYEERVENETGNFSFNPYTINASKSGCSNSTSVDLISDLDAELILEVNVSGNVTENVSALLITVNSPENNSIHFGKDLVNGTSLLLEVETTVNASSCGYMLDSTLVGSLSEVNPKKFRGYMNVSDFLDGEYEITFLCESDALENTTRVIFLVYPERECLSDLHCADDEECEDYACVELSCECGYASNHECVAYECCDNSDCEGDEYCDTTDNECKDVECDCGTAQNHQCVFPYPGYCCDNSHCDANQSCDVINHRCVTQILHIYVPETIVQGETVRVYVGDQNNDSVAGASLTVAYSDSGNMYFFSTGSNGVASIFINESGSVQISARKANYFTGSASIKIAPSFNWLVFSSIFAVICVAILVPAFLFFKKRELFRLIKFGGPLGMEKSVSGGIATLSIKNRGGEALRLLKVVDRVPAGAFLKCNITPEIESVDNTTDRLSWTILKLRPKEEIVIRYKAGGFYKGFSVELGGKRYKA